MGHDHTDKVSELEDLVSLVGRLRAPDGCPWDQKQTLQSVRAYLVEEAHELAAAIDSEDPAEIREELGDLLFQIAFIARLAAEQGHFEAKDAIQGIYDKMIERHPHVFARKDDGSEPKDVDEVLQAWEAGKAAKRPEQSLLAGVPPSLPALTGAYRLTQKAAGVGFDWPDIEGVLAKVKEELQELEEALQTEEAEAPAIREELGDLLFAVANLGRHLKIDPEAALAHGNLKFRRRFGALERIFKQQDESLADADLQAMDDVWEQVKAAERRSI